MESVSEDQNMELFLDCLEEVEPMSNCTDNNLSKINSNDSNPVRSLDMDLEKGREQNRCSDCPKSFRYKSQLAKHILTHSTVRNEKCPFPYCRSAFKAKSK